MTIPLEKSGASIRLALKKGRRAELLSGSLQQTKRTRRQRQPWRNLRQMVGMPDANTRRAQYSLATSRSNNAMLQTMGGPQVGFRPVISIISEGATMSAMAVVSGDRRYVRLSIVPAFNTITDVFTFSFMNNGGNPTGNPGVGGNGN